MSDMNKWVPLVKKLARKAGAVNLIYTPEDLEQEAWINIIRYWPKLKDLSDESIEKNLKVIFKRKMIDVRRSQMRRPDTHWSFKSNVLDTLSKTAAANMVVRSVDPGKDKATEIRRAEDVEEAKKTSEKYGAREIKRIALRMDAGAFSAAQSDPESDYAASSARERLAQWALDLVNECSEELMELAEYAMHFPEPEALQEVEDAKTRLAEAEISLKIIKAILEGEVQPETIKKEMPKVLDLRPQVFNGHWERTLRQARLALGA